MINDDQIESEFGIECLQDSIRLQDGKLMLDRRCVWDVVEFQDSKGFQDIYRKSDGKCLLDIMGI